MGNIEKIIQAIDIQLIQKNKPYMLLAEANRLLTSTRLIADNKALKKIVESGLIPHAYQTQKSPKQWRIPLSEKGKAEKEKLDKQNKQRAKENQYTIQTQILDQPTLCCPFCEDTGIIPEQFRSEPCLICPKYQARNGFGGMNKENQIFTNRSDHFGNCICVPWGICSFNFNSADLCSSGILYGSDRIK